MKKSGKPSSRNLKINTRIVITSILAILIPLAIIASFSTVFINTFNSFFNFSTVTTNSYSTVNQVQWSQTISTITSDLTSDMDEEQTYSAIKNLASHLEEFGTKLYIEKNGKTYYKSENSGDIMKSAEKISVFDKKDNINHFGSNGLLLTNHAEADGDSYYIMIINEEYTVNDLSQGLSFQEFRSFIFGRTGIIILAIVMLFIIAIVVTSFVTTKTIVNPIKEISHGAEEIAKGNLDYTINYHSTNELGQMADSFNNMRLRLEQSLETQKSSDRKRKELVACVAHDLRTPLTSVKGYAEGIRDGIADTPEKKEQYINTICSSIENTERILDDLLAFSKLELDTFSLNCETVNVNEFFSDGAEEIRAELEAEDIEFSFTTTCQDSTTLALDSDRFTRVIRNIVSNSIKYKRNDIQSRFDLKLHEYERTIIIELSDNGIGVDRESLAKIFDTMYRADAARSSVADGSGLGLAICRQIVELHGGSIWATSEVNKGLSIFISMPKEDKK